VNFVNAENRLLGTQTSRIDGIAADDTYYFGEEMRLLTDHPVSRLEIVVRVGRHTPRTLKYPSVSDVGIFPDDENFVDAVTAQVTNVQSGTLRTANASVVLFDAAGNVIGGGDGALRASLAHGVRAVLRMTRGFSAVPYDRAASASISFEPQYS
jgi:hypothetical protein